MTEWTRTTKAVNSKVLLNDISSFIEEGIDDMGVIWGSDSHRESFIGIIEEWLDEKSEEGKIEQYKVACDLRNNKVSDMEKGVFVLEVHYKQRHCANTTQLRYDIKEEDSSGWLEFDITF